MTFLSLSKAQQRELMRAYESNNWLEFSNTLLPTFWRLRDCGLMEVKMSLSYVSRAHITPAGRELVERHLSRQAAKREFLERQAGK